MSAILVQAMGSTVAEKDWSESPVYPLESSRFRTPTEEVPPPYLRRQEEYIEHLEKEGQLYRVSK